MKQFKNLEDWKQVLPPDLYKQLCEKYAHARCRKAETNSDNTGHTPNLERASRNKPLEKKENPRFNRPVNIRIVTVRRRLPRDHLAISEKYLIDALVSAGVIKDDSRKEIKNPPTIELICGYPEQTRIEIIEA